MDKLLQYVLASFQFTFVFGSPQIIPLALCSHPLFCDMKSASSSLQLCTRFPSEDPISQVNPKFNPLLPLSFVTFILPNTSSLQAGDCGTVIVICVLEFTV